MPNRILREAFLTSEKVNAVFGPAESFFVRLMLVADDFGRFYAHPNIIRAKCYPLRDDVKTSDVKAWLIACAQAGLIKLYVVESRQYLEIQQFQQRTRTAVSKFPSNDGQMTVKCQTLDGQMTVNGQTSAHVFVVEDVFEVGDVCVSGEACARKSKKSKITDAEWLEMLKKNPAFTGIDIDKEKARAESWCMTNNRTCSRKFFVNWLLRVEKRMTGTTGLLPLTSQDHEKGF